MRTEVPVCQKCCMCLPLRYGLIAWGYLRLILAGFVLVWISFIIDQYEQLFESGNGKHRATISETVILCLALIIVIVDIVLGIIFIVGCYKKNSNLIRIYYRHSLFLLTILIPLCVYIYGSYLHYMANYSRMPLLNLTLYVITDFVGLFAYVVIQIYVVLLVRSEIIKLKNGCQFRFENKVTEEEFPLNTVSSNGGKVTEDKKEIDGDEDI